MPTVFVYEYCTALGLDPAHSLWREGHAMRSACVADFERIPGVAVRSDGDFAHFAATSDATLVIAPETNRQLLTKLFQAEKAGAKRLLNASGGATNVTGDKRYLSDVWGKAGVPTPTAYPFEGVPIGYPFVVKLRDGAGSVAMRHIRCAGDWDTLKEIALLDGFSADDLILQPFVPGVAASVAFLVGPNCVVPLLPGYQRLSDDGHFTYLGGEIPMPDGLTLRAVKLARRAIHAVPGLAGYVGVDLVLGDAADGSGDFAIEINPRLTTSYVGLRALTGDNLMAKLWDVCDGATGVRVKWHDGGVRFTPDGTVTRFA